jgi:hypothetical protein
MHAVDMKRVFEQPDLPAVVRLAAWQALQAKSYMKPGVWLRNLHDIDLVFLINLVEQCKGTTDNPATSTLITLTMVLVQAEGLEFDDPAVLNNYVNQLGMFLIIESLGRKGVTDVHHDNISFDDAAGNLSIAETK